MFGFLKSKQAESNIQPGAHPVTASLNSMQQQSNLRRELIRVVLKDTLRLQGIPLGWIACEVILIPRAPGEDELHIQLIVMKWNEQLLRYASALQQQLLLGLDRFDPQVDHSKYIVSWRFAADCACPFSKMPDPGVWIQNTTKNTTTEVIEEPLSVLDRRHAKRPSTEPQHEIGGFSPTQLTSLL